VRLGVQLFVVIANWPTARIEHWITLLRARAIENQAYLVGVNRCGADPKLQYPGRSLVVDPQGVILADAGEQEGVTSAQIDLEKLTSWRREFPVLVDMRADFAPAPPA
jgi:predicted amidohydrolase